MASVLSQINTARTPDAFGNATWTGVGITSSVAAANPNNFAVGAIDNSSLGPAAYATFFSQPADLTSVLVRYTVIGDANLDGQISTSDFMALATNFNQAAATWGGGDFNFDGTVNALDFNAVATNFGTVLPAPSAPVGSLFSDQPIDGKTLQDGLV